MKVKIIAEAGVNHNGSISKALKLVDIASKAGADYVKFQLFDPSKLVTKDTALAGYQRKNLKSNISQFQMLKKINLTKEQVIKIHKYCKKKKIKFLATAFDIDNLKFLLKLGQDYIKIPSGEITNGELLDFVRKRKEKVILSTGASSIKDIKNAINKLKKKSGDLIIMHCNSSYPAKLNELNLNVITNFRKNFKNLIGYSDHSLSTTVPAVTIALGAKVLEKHFTLNRNLSGPDHKASLTPYELKDMIERIRETEMTLGEFKKFITKNEIKNKDIIRRSIYASKFIKKGEKFSEKNLICLRPDKGLSAIYWKNIIGKRAMKNFKENEKIKKK